MSNRVFLHDDVRILAKLTESETVFEGDPVTQYGLAVSMLYHGTVISMCSIDCISDNMAFVRSVAESIVNERITPAGAFDYIEEELSK